MRTSVEYFECNKLDCIHNVNGLCKLLLDEVENEAGCTFYKTQIEDVLENGALTSKPRDWESYRRHSGTKPVTKNQLYKWIKKMEILSPCEDPEAAKIVDMYLNHNYMSITEAIQRVTAYLEEHPDGCAWAMSPKETALMIFKEEVRNVNKTHETNEKVSDVGISG